MPNTEQIQELIGKIISGNADAQDSLEFENWLAESEDNRKIYEVTLKTWNGAEAWLDPDLVRQDKLKIIREVNQQLILQSNRSKRRSVIYLAAAILAFPVAIAAGFLFQTDSFKGDPAVCEVSAPKGHISKCTLPDGTEVWVNAGSSVSYDPLAFAGQKRELQLNGEAYFKVTKNGHKPFSVHTELAEVVVTGTSFNVKAFAGSGTFETVLSQGSIDLQLGNEYDNRRLKVSPGEKVVLTAGSREIGVQKVNDKIYSAWRNGEIIFQDATLDELIGELERIYDVKFKLLEPELANYRFRGIFRYDSNLIDALEKFRQTAHIDYYIKNKEVWLNKQ